MLAETAQELLVVFRAEVKDDRLYSTSDDTQCLWRDSEILGYMTEAVDSLATATNGLFETITIAFLADDRTVALPERVLHIHSARLVTRDCPVTVENDNSAPLYHRLYSDEASAPYAIIRDMDATLLRFYPVPTAADSLEMRCSVTLEYPLESDDDVPFSKSKDQRLLLEYMKWRAYSKQDAETEDLVRAGRAKETYDLGAVVRESEIRNQRRAPGLIQMDW